MNTKTRGRIKGQTTGRRNQHGRTLVKDSTGGTRDVLLFFHHDQPRASSPVNDNYCVKILQTGKLARSKQPTPEETMNIFSPKTLVNSVVVNPVLTAPRLLQKKGISRRVWFLSEMQIKICERCFLCRSIVLCKTCNKCSTCCLKSTCKGQTSKLLANLAGSECRSESSSNPQTELHHPLSDPALTRSPTIISCYVNPHKNFYLLEALHQLMDKNAVKLVQNEKSLGFINRLFLVPKPNNRFR